MWAGDRLPSFCAKTLDDQSGDGRREGIRFEPNGATRHPIGRCGSPTAPREAKQGSTPDQKPAERPDRFGAGFTLRPRARKPSLRLSPGGNSGRNEAGSKAENEGCKAQALARRPEQPEGAKPGWTARFRTGAR